MFTRASLVLIVLLSGILEAVCVGGVWIEASAEADSARFAPVPLYWFTISQTPYVYRTEIEVPAGADRATVVLRTAGYVYVWVDGVQRYAWEPRPEDRKNNRPAEPADRRHEHTVDLSDCLTPGRHVICVSAPKAGFVLDGAVFSAGKRVMDLATGDGWTVTRLAPTTILEEEGVLRAGYAGPGAKVSVGEPWQAGEDRLAAAYIEALLRRATRIIDDVRWENALLLNKGFYIHEGTAYGWGGPNRLAAGVLEAARGLERLATQANTVRSQIEQAAVANASGLAGSMGHVRRLEDALQKLAAEAEALSAEAAACDERKAVHLASELVATRGETEDAGAARLAIERRLDHPLNNLNESRYDRLGWIDHPELVDSDISRWGIRINPVSGPTRVSGPKSWLFSTDAGDEGIGELRYTIGYNIENQWPQLRIGDGWQADSRFGAFRGIGWYRARLHVPAEWAPNAVRLSFRAAGLVRGWINDREITHGAQRRGDSWVYSIDADKVNFGGENYLAFRIEADGDKRGILGGLELTCPKLEGAGGDGTAVDILATPLSPCVVLNARAGRLSLQYEAASVRLILPSGSGVGDAAGGRYDASESGRLPSNWAILWLESKELAGPQRPVLLVFADSPKSIAAGTNGTQIELASTENRVIAVRPWVKAVPGSGDKEAIVTAVEFWRRAALAVPVNYMNLTRVAKAGEDYADMSIGRIPRGPVLEQTYIYDYLETADAWGTEPLRIAPLPALCTYAVDRRYRGLELDVNAEVRQDGGLLAGYKAVTDCDRLRYRYPIEPYPRFTGFTSWMFSGVDAGVPGNKRELELIAWIGANSYRPQHNWADELPPRGFFPADEKRTRVEITADYCNAVGVNYMNNIDQTLGPHHRMVKEDYDNFIVKVYLHYEKIARQLHDRPFWAVAYDLINEPFDHKADKYNPAMRELTRRIRAIDERHLCYIEPCQAWGAIQNLHLVEPTGDLLTVYSFHDYNFRLFKREDRWPTLERDIRNIHRMWLPAYKYMIDYGLCMHCGEFGGFAPATDGELAQTVLLNDFFRVFDQFGMHSHYYSGRELFGRQADGSLKPSNVVKFYRSYLRKGPNRYYLPWPGHPQG